MRKKLLLILCMLFVMIGVFANGSGESQEKEDDIVNVAICLSTGGLGDKNFNDMAYNGLLKAKETYNINFDYFEPKTSSDFEQALRQFADIGKYDLIIGIGNDMVDSFKEVCPDYPDQKFSLIDARLELDNVHSIETRWQDQTFLCGVYAGLGTLSDMEDANSDNVIGVMLGMDFPSLQAGVVGFEAGARYVNKDCKVLKATVGSFADPAKGKEIAISMYNRGADFIQPIAGSSGLGVFTAALEKGFYAFGVGGNQNYIEPTVVAATSIRNVDEMIFNEVKSIVDGTWINQCSKNGLIEDAVGYSNELSQVVIPEDIENAISDIKAKIKNGDLVICSTAEELESWLDNNQY